MIGEFQVNGFAQSDSPTLDEIGGKLGKMECLKWSRQAEPMGELAGKSPVAMRATGYQRRDTLVGDILDQPFPIFPSFLLEAGEEQWDTTAPVNAQRLIWYPRLSEKGLQGTAELFKEEDGTSEKETDMLITG